MNATNNPTPTDLLSLKEACKLVPSPYGGHVHINTMRRWCLSGRLRHWRNGPWLLVRKADVMALMTAGKPTPTVPIQEVPSWVPSPEKAAEILRKRGK